MAFVLMTLGANADSISMNVGATPPVSEPASLFMLGTGLLAIIVYARRRLTPKMALSASPKSNKYNHEY